MAHRGNIGAVVLMAVLFVAGYIPGLANSSDVFYFHGRAGYLQMPAGGINFGASKMDPSDPRHRRTCFEAVNALPITYRTYRWVITTYHASWEVKISGDNFTSGEDSIPISQLKWKAPGGNYKNMPSQGDWDTVDRSANYRTVDEQSAEHTLPLSFYLPMTNDEYGGTYQGKIYATLVFY